MLLLLLKEFDRQAAQEVQELFDVIDHMLYEQSSKGPLHLLNECSEWVSTFPHLRSVVFKHLFSISLRNLLMTRFIRSCHFVFKDVLVSCVSLGLWELWRFHHRITDIKLFTWKVYTKIHQTVQPPILKLGKIFCEIMNILFLHLDKFCNSYEYSGGRFYNYWLWCKLLKIMLRDMRLHAWY